MSNRLTIEYYNEYTPEGIIEDWFVSDDRLSVCGVTLEEAYENYFCFSLECQDTYWNNYWANFEEEMQFEAS